VPARVVDPEPVRAWVVSEAHSTTVEQYAIQVRRFYLDCKPVDLSAVTEEQLVRYASAILQKPSRRKMVSGLAAFFGHLTKIRTIPHDPARYLSRLVRKALLEQTLVAELRRAGIPLQEARRLSWRDVAAAAIGPKSAARAKHLLPLNARLRRTLTAGLLAQLHSVHVDDLKDVLDAPVIHYS
jgi:hypothetical protein